MLTIRKEQMDLFYAAHGGRFEEVLASHLRTFAPSRIAPLTDAQLRQFIDYGMERADHHGFELRGPTRFYVETMIILGCDFDTDPQYPWAFSVLSDQDIGDEVARADLLHDRLFDYLQAASTPVMIQRAWTALQGALQWPPPPGADDEYIAPLLYLARRVYPEKFACLGEVSLRILIADTLDRADYFAMDDWSGIALHFALAYALGHGYADDPQYPWVAESLAQSPPTQARERLNAQLRSYLCATVADLGPEA